MRLCPYCAETISDRDSSCPHCHEPIVAPGLSTAQPEPVLVLEGARRPADAPQRAEPPPEIIKLKEAMRPYYEAGFEKVRLTRRHAEMIKRKEGFNALNVVMMALFFFFCWPVAVLILVELIGKKDKRVFFELEEDGNIDIYGDTLETGKQEEQKKSSRTMGVVFLALLVIIILIMFMWVNQRAQPQVFVLPNPQGPGWQGPIQPPARASAFELGIQFGKDAVEAAGNELNNN